MRKSFFALLWLLVACDYQLYAQTAAADSLLTLLKNHKAQDTTAINAMNDLAREWRRSKPAQADSLINLTLALSAKLNYPKGMGRALLAKGTRLYDLADYPAAHKTFNEAEQYLLKCNDKKGLGQVLRVHANLLMDDGKHAQSLDYFLRALKTSQDAGDIKGVIETERTIGYFYNVLGEFDKAIPYQEDALKQALRIDYKTGISGAYNAIGKTHKTSGNYPAALEAYSKGLAIDEQTKDSANIYVAHGNIADVYERMGNYKMAFHHIWKAYNYYKKVPRSTMIPWDEWIIAKAYTHSGRPDSGMYYGKHSLMLSHEYGWRLYLREITQIIAEAAVMQHKWDTAYKYQVLSFNYKDSLTGQEIARKTSMLQASFELDKKQAEIALLTKDKQLQVEENKREKAFLVAALGGLVSLIVFAVVLYRNNRHKQRANTLLQRQKKEIDSKANELSQQKEILEQSYSNVELLSEIGRKITSSLSVETIIGTVYDNVNSLMDASVFGIGIYHDDSKTIDFPATYENGAALPAYSNSIYDENRFAALCFRSGNEIIMGDLQNEYKNFLQNFPVTLQGDQPVSLIYLPLKAKDKLLGVITVQSFRKQAFGEYHLYMLRNIAIYTSIALENAESFKKLNQTVDDLKATQSQLIQSEKMASLGELTAGIAHEIQNPLNFVNNFSELNKELLEELNEELVKGNIEEAKALANDVILNEEKIIFHGRRADGIVKGMLQHSRSSTGTKELTDINALCDEYLRLAYHGLRAKDKSFNSRFELLPDTTIGEINIIPQDIGRVVLNLINNAFYAVSAKRRLQLEGYEPIVTISTHNLGDKVEIWVADNGTGIPEKAMEKIFQPFFTTKPTGEGTGLGLSLSYDIITKAHGGDLKVETKEGEGTTFIITIPKQHS